MNHEEFFEEWHKRKANFNSMCFLCGTSLTKNNKSKEHIFPKWLLAKFNLWDLKISLLNKTNFTYRNAIVPCCKICNNEHLSELENEIRNGIEKGYDYFSQKVDKLKIYQWCLCIFYKILLKETFLKADLKKSDSPKIVSERQFELLSLNRLMLRSIDKEVKMENFFPGSIVIVKTEIPDDENFSFDYLDNPIYQTLCIRMNDIGIVAVFNDAENHLGLLKNNIQPLLNKEELSPTDFRLLYAKFLHASYCFIDPFFYYLEDKKKESVKVTLHLKSKLNKNKKADNSERVYKDYKQEDYKMILEQVFKMKL